MSDDAARDPTPEEVLDWLEGRLTADRAAAVLAAIERSGSDARDFAEWAASFRRYAALLPLVAPPPLVSQRLRRMYAARLTHPRPVVQLLAVLEVDSRQPDSLVSVRAPVDRDSGRVQLAYRAGATSIVVDIMPAQGGTVTLRGQVLAAGDTLPSFQVTAQGPSGSVTSISGDDLGGFVLEEVPDDSELLLLTNDELLIEVPIRLSGEPE